MEWHRWLLGHTDLPSLPKFHLASFEFLLLFFDFAGVIGLETHCKGGKLFLPHFLFLLLVVILFSSCCQTVFLATFPLFGGVHSDHVSVALCSVNPVSLLFEGHLADSICEVGHMDVTIIIKVVKSLGIVKRFCTGDVFGKELTSAIV